MTQTWTWLCLLSWTWFGEAAQTGPVVDTSGPSLTFGTAAFEGHDHSGQFGLDMRGFALLVSCLFLARVVCRITSVAIGKVLDLSDPSPTTAPYTLTGSYGYAMHQYQIKPKSGYARP